MSTHIPSETSLPYGIEWLPTAAADLEEAVRCVARAGGSQEAGERFALKVVRAADSLAGLPYRRPVYRPLRRLGHEARWLLVDGWYMFFWVEEGRHVVTIARVVYARRDLDATDVADLYPHLG